MKIKYVFERQLQGIDYQIYPHCILASTDFFFPYINNMMVVKSSRFRKDHIVLPKYFRSITLFMKQVLSAIIDS